MKDGLFMWGSKGMKETRLPQLLYMWRMVWVSYCPIITSVGLLIINSLVIEHSNKHFPFFHFFRHVLSVTSFCYKVKLCENHRQSFINKYRLYCACNAVRVKGLWRKGYKDSIFLVTYFETRTINQIMCTMRSFSMSYLFPFLISLFFFTLFFSSFLFLFIFQSWEAFGALLLWRMFSIINLEFLTMLISWWIRIFDI